MNGTGTGTAWLPARYATPLWIAVGLLLVLSFLVGHGLGRRRVAVAPTLPDLALVEGVPGRELADLLADVERTQLADASEAVEYPAFFAGEDGVTVPREAPVMAAVQAAVGPAREDRAPPADPRPSAPYTIVLVADTSREEARALRTRLRDAGVHAWADVRRIDGAEAWRVAVGAFEDAAVAEQAAARLAPLWRPWLDAPEVGVGAVTEAVDPAE